VSFHVEDLAGIVPHSWQRFGAARGAGLVAANCAEAFQPPSPRAWATLGAEL